MTFFERKRDDIPCVAYIVYDKMSDKYYSFLAKELVK